jgi:MFS family permease
MQSALAPLGPIYATELGLGRVQVGALFAATSVVMVAATLPIGVVTDRLGARRLTVAAAVLVAVSAAGQGLAHDFWLLLASRAIFGLAFGAVWTAGIAFLAEGDAVAGRSALGAAIPVAGAAAAIGPAFAGVGAARLGLAPTFVAIAAVAAVAALFLLLTPEPVAAAVPERIDLVAMVRAARTNRLVLGAAAMMTAGGLSSSLAFLLVPLRLHANGVSLTAIGSILGASALLYVAGGIVASRLGARAVAPSVAGAAVLALGASLLLPALSSATAVLVAFLLARSACTSVTSTIAYPLAATGAAETGLGAGAAIGLVNAAWATSTVVAPLAGGAVAQAAGDKLAFALLVPFAFGVSAWLVRSGGVRLRAPLRAARLRRSRSRATRSTRAGRG